jgi:hypothetical protein
VAPSREGQCRVCRRNVASLTFEHVPPRRAFNNEAARVYGWEDWLQRDEDGMLTGGRIAQRGSGDHTLCAECNSNTGAWYGNELGRAVRSAVRVMRQMPLDEFDERLEPIWADVRFS